MPTLVPALMRGQRVSTLDHFAATAQAENFDDYAHPLPTRARHKRSDHGSGTEGPLLTVLHISTLNKPVGANRGYSPIETVIENVHRGLRANGHRSIVACSADSRVPGERHVTVPRSLGDDYVRDNTLTRRNRVRRHLSEALERAARGDIDVIHMHEWVEYVYQRSLRPPAPIVMTLHVRASESGLRQARHECRSALVKRSVSFVAISDDQAAEYTSFVTPCATVHHGIDITDFPFKTAPSSGGYLFTIGRITRDKGQDRAIELAKRTGSTLVIAGCVQNKSNDAAFFDSLKDSIDAFVDVNHHPAAPDYFERVIQPVLASGKQIVYIGELGSDQKKHWYRHARGTLFPIQWREPFGLVLIESMACGTPVLAFNKGAVSEIVATGLTGFVVNSMEEMTAAEAHLTSVDPAVCRRHVGARFSTTRMVGRYTDVYREVIGDHERRRPGSLERVPIEMHP